jgi:hypothetical protein
VSVPSAVPEAICRLACASEASDREALRKAGAENRGTI